MLEEDDRLVVGGDGQTYVRRADGTVVGPDGKLLRGSDGRPLRLGERERLIVGADGQRYIRKADGTVVDSSSGQALLGADGSPLRLEEGDKLKFGADGQAYVHRADGTIRGPDGRVMRLEGHTPMSIPRGGGQHFVDELGQAYV